MFSEKLEQFTRGTWNKWECNIKTNYKETAFKNVGFRGEVL